MCAGQTSSGRAHPVTQLKIGPCLPAVKLALHTAAAQAGAPRLPGPRRHAPAAVRARSTGPAHRASRQLPPGRCAAQAAVRRRRTPGRWEAAGDLGHAERCSTGRTSAGQCRSAMPARSAWMPDRTNEDCGERGQRPAPHAGCRPAVGVAQGHGACHTGGDAWQHAKRHEPGAGGCAARLDAQGSALMMLTHTAILCIHVRSLPAGSHFSQVPCVCALMPAASALQRKPSPLDLLSDAQLACAGTLSASGASDWRLAAEQLSGLPRTRASFALRARPLNLWVKVADAMLLHAQREPRACGQPPAESPQALAPHYRAQQRAPGRAIRMRHAVQQRPRLALARSSAGRAGPRPLTGFAGGLRWADSTTGSTELGADLPAALAQPGRCPGSTAGQHASAPASCALPAEVLPPPPPPPHDCWQWQAPAVNGRTLRLLPCMSGLAGLSVLVS